MKKVCIAPLSCTDPYSLLAAHMLVVSQLAFLLWQ